MFKLTFLFVFIFITACGSKDENIRVISGASFGTPESRIQFYDDGKYMKLSYNVGSYDNVSGATYVLKSQDGNIFSYQVGPNKVTLEVVDTNTIEVLESLENTKMIFTPKQKNLGLRPR